ncbi:aminotransferase class I/II-fold pyridoxal phosphate-dependent enzyme [Bacillus massiliglaciei]|uniref:aminotransferase class I/II-fold pyridoxal phosphate-dependent enzyme n=1 Tax=Bacillus massiliglaciei TaxID=1816693 RepID=UPI000AC672C7|nr:aminotransferase class I/II-fold pyridoxal phosphate-dependent enzyme [Bacillus massiliglaciei]
MDQSKTPLFEALVNHRQNSPVSYHVPGHKNGRLFMEKGKILYQSILSIDATEITGLDDLHAPEGPIREAQSLLADFYGAKESFFLVNGSTAGNIAMILAACGEGDTVLVQRNCHKSILHGLMLANVRPVFLHPMIHEEWGIAGGIQADIVEKAFSLYPESKALVLTYPNYYGLGQDIQEIIQLAHKKGIPVLVDEAHGAHFAAGAPFPMSALSAGADAVVHSAHKTLPAMTMGSYLHLHDSSYINEEKVRFYLQMLQSSSPSYPIMASLDLARSYIASFTKEDCEALIKRINAFRKSLQWIDGIEVLDPPQGAASDPLKVSIRSVKGLSGFRLQEKLEEAGIYTELADSYQVLFVLPLLKKEDDYDFGETVRLIEKAAVSEQIDKENLSSFSLNRGEGISELKLSFSKMKTARKKIVPFEKAMHEIAAEMIIPYPPGIPLIMSGEIITGERMDTLQRLLKDGARFQGGDSLAERKIAIYEKDSDGLS